MSEEKKWQKELRLMKKLHELNQDIDKLCFARDEIIEELHQLNEGTESFATSTEDRNPENPVTERCNDSVTTTSSEGEGVGGDTGQ